MKIELFTWLYGRALWESRSDQRLGLSYVRFAQRVFNEMGESAKSELSDVQAWLEQHQLSEAAASR